MIFTIKCIIICIIAYLLGSLNSSIIISKKFSSEDIRNENSGNAGATNMARTFGRKLGVITFICDIVKFFIALLIAYLVIGSGDFPQNSYLYISAVGFFCMIGHMYPCFFKFRGGKGVTVCAGMIISLDWRIALILILVFICVTLSTKYISLGSIFDFILFPLLELIFFKSDSLSITDSTMLNETIAVLIALVFSLFIICKHIPNMKRIHNGTENKIHIHK